MKWSQGSKKGKNQWFQVILISYWFRFKHFLAPLFPSISVLSLWNLSNFHIVNSIFLQSKIFNKSNLGRFIMIRLVCVMCYRLAERANVCHAAIAFFLFIKSNDFFVNSQMGEDLNGFFTLFLPALSQMLDIFALKSSWN